MSAREWKPGDVAMVRNEYGVWNVALRVVGAVADEWQYGVTRAVAPLNADVRPLAVIDPEDREQVERFVTLYFKTFWAMPGAGRVVNGGQRDAVETIHLDAMQATLREFADPTPPKPPEPTGLGAVVEDIESVQWVRVVLGPGLVWRRVSKEPSLFSARRYDDIAVANVLHEGVQP